MDGGGCTPQEYVADVFCGPVRIVICDNILYKGMVSCDDLAPRKQNTIIQNLRDFLSYISHHPQLETSIVPIGDGVSLSVKLQEEK